MAAARTLEDAHRIISKFKMSDHLTRLDSKCRSAIDTPVLEVRAIVR